MQSQQKIKIMSKKLKWILIGLAALIVVMIIAKKSGKEEGVEVATEKVQRKTIVEVVNAPGKIYPELEVRISPDISGVVTELNVQEGDTVKKGQILARIDAEQYNIQKGQAASGVAQTQAQVAQTQAQVAQTQAQLRNSQAALESLGAQLDQAQQNFNRLKQLFDDKVISQSELDVATTSLRSAKANYNAALQGINGGQASVKGGQANVQSAIASVQASQASLQRANKDLRRTIITAPRDGVVSLLNVKKGESVAGNSFNVGTEILRIADMNSIEIRVDVPENDIPKIHLGDSADVNVDAYMNKKFKGVVYQIASSQNGAVSQNAINSANDVTNYKVYIRLIPQSYMELITPGSFPFRPGMTASADIKTKIHNNAFAVPINAVTTRDKNEKGDKGAKVKKDEAALVTEEDDMEVVVFTLQKDGRVKKVKVKTGIQDTKYIEILEGIKDNDEVIAEPYNTIYRTLKDSMKVKVVKKEDLFKVKN